MMNRRALFVLLVSILVVTHFFLHVGLSIGRGAPDLLTLALLLVVRQTGMGWGGGLGFLFGLLEDAFSILAFGANALAMTVVGILGARTRDLFVGDSLLFFFVYLGLGKFLRDLIHWVFAADSLRKPFLNAVLVDGGVNAIYMASVGVLLLLFFSGTRDLR